MMHSDYNAIIDDLRAAINALDDAQRKEREQGDPDNELIVLQWQAQHEIKKHARRIVDYIARLDDGSIAF